MKINYSFIFLLIFSLYTGYFKQLSLFVLCLLIHELGHILFIILFNVKIKKFNLSFYGGILELDNNQYNNLEKYKKVLIYLGGILFNFIFYLIFKKYSFSNYHLILLIFNLLPIYPLDGYNILRILIPNIVINNISVIFIVSLLIFSIYNNSLGLIMISIILIIKNIRYYREKDKIYLLKLINNMV